MTFYNGVQDDASNSSAESSASCIVDDDSFVHIKDYYMDCPEIVDPCSTTSRVYLCQSGSPTVLSNISVTAGHVLLNYMENYAENPSKIVTEWEELQKTESRSNEVEDRPGNCESNNDKQLNPSIIRNSNLSCRCYAVAVTPDADTFSEFWQMIWNCGSNQILDLYQSSASTTDALHNYWPVDGSKLYFPFEVHLVSEHVSCADFVVRSFYVRDITSEASRTITQFQYRRWTDEDVPANMDNFLNCVRKLLRSFREAGTPTAVHCRDGRGRSGLFCLIAIILERLNSGANEINFMATVEHLRDQRSGLLCNKEQYQFAFTAIAREVCVALRMR